MADRTKVFRRDGKLWRFEPGEGGSLTEIRSGAKPKSGFDIRTRPSRSKVIMAEGLDEGQKKKKKRPFTTAMIDGKRLITR